MFLAKRLVPRRTAGVVLRVNIGTVGQQQFDSFFPPSNRGLMQRRIAISVSGIDVCPAVAKQTHHPGSHSLSNLSFTSLIQICTTPPRVGTVACKSTVHFRIVHRDNGSVERRSAQVVAGVDSRTSGQENLCDVLMSPSDHPWRPALIPGSERWGLEARARP